MTRVAIIPARGGSVRIPRKNIRDFMGKPMMQWPIDAIHASGLFGRIIVSTDDAEIAGIADWLGCDVHRRPADDGATGTQELAAQVLEWSGAVPDDEVCVVYPCSPMLRGTDLIDSLNALTERVAFVWSILDGRMTDAGCFYWGRAEAFLKRLPLRSDSLNGQLRIGIQVDTRRFIDINTPEDWARAESMFTALRRAHV